MVYCTSSMTSLPPPLLQQLILELEIRVEAFEFLIVDPACFYGRTVRPDQQLNATPYDHAEWKGVNGGLEGGVVTVLCPSEPLQPLPRPIADEVAQIHDDDLVDSL
jgi:hypothetical protein